MSTAVVPDHYVVYCHWCEAHISLPTILSSKGVFMNVDASAFMEHMREKHPGKEPG